MSGSSIARRHLCFMKGVYGHLSFFDFVAIVRVKLLTLTIIVLK